MPKKLPKAKASTQEHLDVEDITEDMVILKTGWVALVMSTTAVNFDLLSEAEQDATIYAYGAFLNSLSFPIQVLIRSKKADITAYFSNLEEAERIQPNPDLKRQIQKYKDFIQSTVQQKTVLDKKFYLIITFSPLELGFKGLRGKKSINQKSKSQLVIDAKAALAPKRDHVIGQTARLGLTTRQLTTQELIELFYDIYNPAPIGTQRILLDTTAYTTPIVQPALEVPTPAPFDGAPAPQSSAQQSGVGPAPSGPVADAEQSPTRSEALPRTVGSQEPEVRAGGQPTSQPEIPPTNSQSTPNSAILPSEMIANDATPKASSVPFVPIVTTPQLSALKNLQDATARAQQIVNKPPDTSQNITAGGTIGGTINR